MGSLNFSAVKMKPSVDTFPLQENMSLVTVKTTPRKIGDGSLRFLLDLQLWSLLEGSDLTLLKTGMRMEDAALWMNACLDCKQPWISSQTRGSSARLASQ